MYHFVFQKLLKILRKKHGKTQITNQKNLSVFLINYKTTLKQKNNPSTLKHFTICSKTKSKSTTYKYCTLVSRFSFSQLYARNSKSTYVF